jgi:hypothetical protein
VRITHHDLAVDLNDEWWIAGGMEGFVPTSAAYRCDAKHMEVLISDIGPVDPQRRSIGVLRDDVGRGISASDRVVKILRGFREGQAIPPVVIVDGEAGYGFKYRPTEGAHRLYCSIAAGFTRVPAVRREPL